MVEQTIRIALQTIKGTAGFSSYDKSVIQWMIFLSNRKQPFKNVYTRPKKSVSKAGWQNYC